jgi:hypothetical protein
MHAEALAGAIGHHSVVGDGPARRLPPHCAKGAISIGTEIPQRKVQHATEPT